MEPEANFLVLVLALLLAVISGYAFAIRAKLWFYERLIATVKNVIPGLRSNDTETGGCALVALVIIFLLSVFLALISWQNLIA